MLTNSPALAPQDLGRQREMATDTPELVQAAREILLQGLGLLFELSDSTYTRNAGAPFHAAIGSHYRNVLERFQHLVRGMPAGEINYGVLLETSRLQDEVRYACIATCDVLRALKPYTEDTLQLECKVTIAIGYGGKQASAESNIGQELTHCIGQALHHYGIIRLICEEFRITVPAEFGVAPSALQHIGTRVI